MTTASPSATRSAIGRIVGESRRAAEALESALQDERAALEANDADALGTATSAKHEPVSRLAALERERATVARAAGFDPGPGAMDALLGWCDLEAALADEWRRFLDVARHCERLNTTNGAIIRLRRQQVMAGLAILRGGDVSPETYAASGVEAGSLGGRALAQA